MAFIAREVSIQAVHATARLLPLIAKHDRDLHSQLKRSLTSIASNVSESAHSDDGNRRARLFNAAGSANEARTQLELAVAFGYVQQSEAAEADPAPRSRTRVALASHSRSPPVAARIPTSGPRLRTSGLPFLTSGLPLRTSRRRYREAIDRLEDVLRTLAADAS